jgi:predicted NUDIX family phosphoesterase
LSASSFLQTATYRDRKAAELDFSVKQIVTYILVLRGQQLLTYRRGRFTTASVEIRGARSIGFGGHVADTDCDLWSSSSFGIANNSIRELSEELDLAGDFGRMRGGNFSLLAFLNVDESDEAKRHMAAVIAYRCPPWFEPRKGELSINDLRWSTVREECKKLSEFELWSRLLIEQLQDDSTSLNLLHSNTRMQWEPRP